MARGGRRNGQVGTAYGNRSDLNGGKLPVQTPPSAQYGQSAQLQAAQKAVPMGPPPSGPPPGPPPPGGAAPPSAEPPQPGSLGDLMRGTERPMEPITAGIPSGPGPGPRPDAAVPTTVSDLLNVLTSTPGVSPEIKYLNDWLRSGRA